MSRPVNTTSNAATKYGICDQGYCHGSGINVSVPVRHQAVGRSASAALSRPINMASNNAAGAFCNLGYETGSEHNMSLPVQQSAGGSEFYSPGYVTGSENRVAMPVLSQSVGHSAAAAPIGRQGARRRVNFPQFPDHAPETLRVLSNPDLFLSTTNAPARAYCNLGCVHGSENNVSVPIHRQPAGGSAAASARTFYSPGFVTGPENRVAMPVHRQPVGRSATAAASIGRQGTRPIAVQHIPPFCTRTECAEVYRLYMESVPARVPESVVSNPELCVSNGVAMNKIAEARKLSTLGVRSKSDSDVNKRKVSPVVSLDELERSIHTPHPWYRRMVPVPIVATGKFLGKHRLLTSLFVSLFFNMIFLGIYIHCWIG